MLVEQRAPQHYGRVGQHIAKQQLAADVGVLGRVALDPAAELANCLQPGAAHAHMRLRVKKRDLAFQARGHADVIAIHPCDIDAARQRQPLVETHG